jgi:hypothetical protein
MRTECCDPQAIPKLAQCLLAKAKKDPLNVASSLCIRSWTRHSETQPETSDIAEHAHTLTECCNPQAIRKLAQSFLPQAKKDPVNVASSLCMRSWTRHSETQPESSDIAEPARALTECCYPQVIVPPREPIQSAVTAERFKPLLPLVARPFCKRTKVGHSRTQPESPDVAERPRAPPE